MCNSFILVTGGAGYIGSHTLVALDEAGYSFVVYDNLCNSSSESIKRVEKIIGKSIKFEQGDIRDKEALENLFRSYDIDSVIHFAGLKAVGESVEQPLKYYDNNVNETLVLLEVMKEFNCKKTVFSTSTTVYGDPASTPIKEDFPNNLPQEILGWSATKTLDEMCEDSWRWQMNNPDGYITKMTTLKGCN